MKISILGVKICDERSPWHLQSVNIVIDRGKIAYVGSEKKQEGVVIQGKGKWLTPGWFDLWSSFCDPGFEHKEDLESGSEAATHGGFTGVAVLPNTSPVTETKNNLKYIISRNDHRITKLFPLAAVSSGTHGSEITEMIDLHENGAVAFTDGVKTLINTDLMVKALQYLQKFEGTLIHKPMDPDLSKFGDVNEGMVSISLGMKGIPAIAEELIVKRDIDLLEYAGGKLHFSTISTTGSVDIVRKAKKGGLDVSCSIASFQPLLTENDIGDFDTNMKVDPPLRTEADNNGLIKGLNDGTISVIVSAHNPQDTESKKLEFDLADFGMIGLQTVAPNITSLAERVKMEILLKAITLAPRDLLDLPVPVIDVDNSAEVTLFDPEKKWIFDQKTNCSKSTNSPYYGKELKGCIEMVINGDKIWHNDLYK